VFAVRKCADKYVSAVPRHTEIPSSNKNSLDLDFHSATINAGEENGNFRWPNARPRGQGSAANKWLHMRGEFMNRIRVLFAAALLCGFGTALYCVGPSNNAGAQDKKGPNVQESPKGVKESPKTKAMDDMALAAQLIQYGRREKSAESLLLAAQMMHKTSMEKLGAERKTEGGTKAEAPASVDDSPKALVAEAKKMSNSPQTQALAKATQQIIDESSRGPAGGPRFDNFTILPGQKITWDPVTFIGLQPATVHINNRVFGNMILEVFDQFGNRVAVDSTPGTFFRVNWTPAFNGTFTIRLTNRDTIAFNCSLVAS
jgi:hypothetical protein